MFRLTREVRFAINRTGDLPAKAVNGYAGSPPLIGLGQYLALRIALSGGLDPDVQFLVNIKDIDRVVRERAIAIVAGGVRERVACPNRLVAELFEALKSQWPTATLDSITLCLSPFTHADASRQELPMTRFSQKFEFSASHRLHSEKLSPDENAKAFGKCNNPHGHGHNYELQVTLLGTPRADGLLVDLPALERTVADTVIQRFDHKNLNIEIDEFRELIPTVENIAMVIYRLLKPKFDHANAQLASVTVWETPKTWCEYSE